MLKLRNFVAVALVLGVAAGIWLGDFWKGFGGGNGLGLGKNGAAVAPSDDGKNATPISHVKESTTSHAAKTLRVVIRDRSYFLKDGGEEQRISLDELVQLARNTPGDDDGLRLRIFRAEDARVTAEVQLREALQQAQIPESAAYWSPDATQ